MRYLGKEPVGAYHHQIGIGDGGNEYLLDERVHNAYGILVFVGGVVQRPSIDYIARESIIFSDSLTIDDEFLIYFLFKSITTITPTENSITSAHVDERLFATPDDIREGTSTTKIVTPYSISDLAVIANDKTIPAAISLNTFTDHTNPLGVVPKFFRIRYICVEAEYGYLPGDVTERNNRRQDGGGSGFSFVEGIAVMSYNASTIRTATASSAPSITRRDTGAIARLTPTKWNFYVEVFA